MDRETFDQQLMGYLFDELDEVGRTTVKRRLDTDVESRELEQRLRLTIGRTRLPLETPNAQLEERILEAAMVAEYGEPASRKMMRALSWAGSHAMRPQFAMAALAILLLGSSLLLVRARPGAMRVSAEGTAIPMPAVSVEPTRAQPSPVSNEPAPYEPPADAAARHASDETTRSAGDVEAGDTPARQLTHAREIRASAGCKEALPLFTRLRERLGASGFGADATFEEALCLRELHESARAEELLEPLREHPEYRATISDRSANDVPAKPAASSAR